METRNPRATHKAIAIFCKIKPEQRKIFKHFSVFIPKCETTYVFLHRKSHNVLYHIKGMKKAYLESLNDNIHSFKTDVKYFSYGIKEMTDCRTGWHLT